MTTSLLRGISRLMFFRLFTLAPRMRMASEDVEASAGVVPASPGVGFISLVVAVILLKCSVLQACISRRGTGHPPVLQPFFCMQERREGHCWLHEHTKL